MTTNLTGFGGLNISDINRELLQVDIHAHLWTYGLELIIKDPSDPDEVRKALATQTAILIENGADPVLMGEMISLIQKNIHVAEFYRSAECNQLKIKIIESMAAFAQSNPSASRLFQPANPAEVAHLTPS